MAATKLNIFATSSSKGFLRCLEADAGHVIVGSDINSLEPHVLAEYSQDKGFLQIYGKGKPTNCIYMYLGAHSPVHGELIRTVYNPENPDPDTLEQAKKVVDENGVPVRQLYKVVVLSCNYQGGASTLYSSMRKNNIDITEEQCQELVKLHRRIFSGLPRFARMLDRQCQQNGGYILTGRGRPLAIPRDKRTPKDYLAFFCQATGHDFLTRLIWHMSNYRKQHNLEQVTRPFLLDFHDATYWHVKEGHENSVVDMIHYGYDRLNDELDLGVEFKGNIKIGKDFTIK